MRQIQLDRLYRCMQRAAAGEELTLGFLGGSITQGSLASAHELCCAYRVFDWWCKSFPQAVFHYVNAGIGGTSSHFGAARAREDLLLYQPDFVMIDFSVNDAPTAFFQETYEGVLRQVLAWASRPAVLIWNNICYDTGETAQPLHNAVGDWYGVPHVSIGDTLYQQMLNGRYTREELTPDGLHPNDKGHKLVAEQIIAFLEKVKAASAQAVLSDAPEWPLPAPLTPNAYENACRLDIRKISPELNGFRADPNEKRGHLDLFKNGWIGRRAGDRIRFQVEGSCIAVQYRRTIRRPALRASLVLDGDREHPILLDGNFDEDWGDCLALEPVLHHGRPGLHTIEIEILPEEEKARTCTEFYLLSLIVA